jgi:diguanylate cyclase (GGDEF)-like protein/putative nucleotidyltransferase with HDIG domain
MNAFAVVSLVCCFVYASLLLTVLRERQARVRRRFAVYLAVGLLWSFSNLLLQVDWLGATRLWATMAVLGGASIMIPYYDFISMLTRQKGSLASKLGYAAVALSLVPFASLGLIPQSVSVSGGAIEIDYGFFLYAIIAVGLAFFAASVYRLAKELRAAPDRHSRIRTAYLLAGLGLLLAFAFRTSIPPLPKYPVEQIGHLCNALVITYAITRYRLLDLKLVLRRGLVYSSIVTVFGGSVYLLLLLVMSRSVPRGDDSADLVVISASAILMALLFSPMRALVQRAVDKLFYRETYEYRQMVLDFAQRMTTALDPEELAEAMLKPIVRAVGATQAGLLFSRDGYFDTEYAERFVEGEDAVPLKLSADSPLVTGIAKSGGTLSRESIETSPEFRELRQIDRKAIEDAEMELLVPVMSKGSLVAILALARKRSGGLYSGDDVDPVAIENAQLYAEARERSHIDDLTGLSNHRCFHERLDEEIGRCSRFGDIFSLIFMDVDSFKTYNDVYGHVQGDKILREIGQVIVGSVRGIDMAFRYGGDEFTVIVPQASIDEARVVAERLCKRIESATEASGTALTCSVGIASWPTDGVVRESLVQAADAALYHSKRGGRDCIAVASEVKRSSALGVGINPEGDLGVLGTIYALAATVDAKDSYTYGHSKKVSKYATEIAVALDLPEDRVATIRAAALLHDIGKVGVSDEVLIKTSKLHYEDWDSIRSHPHLGVAILKHVNGLSGCLAGILYHHEHYDGSGYPAGMKGENIPLDARILSVADSYDAMTSSRPYREVNMPPREALAELKRCAGTQFDPAIVEVFAALKEGRKPAIAGSESGPARAQ